MSLSASQLQKITLPYFFSKGVNWSTAFNNCTVGVVSIVDVLNSYNNLYPISNNIPAYVTILDDVLTVYIPRTTHKLSSVHNITVLNSDGEKIMLGYSIDSNNNVTVNSNVSLLNHKLIIY